jgi:hypothetical protein
MPAFRLKLKVTDPTFIIERRLRTAISDKINLAANIAAKKVRPHLKQLIEDAILNAPETKSLFGGELQGELGATDTEISSAINNIIDKIINNINISVVNFTPFGNVMRGSIVISIFPFSLTDELISFTNASFLTKQGTQIPWLEWLLTLGDKIIVRRYAVDFLNTRGSRTGLATMTPIKSKGWRVPPQFSGTTYNNFITRSLDDIADLVMYYLKLEFIRAI